MTTKHETPGHSANDFTPQPKPAERTISDEIKEALQVDDEKSPSVHQLQHRVRG